MRTIQSASNRIVQQLFQAPVRAHPEKVNRAERDCDVIHTVASFYTQFFFRVLRRPLGFCVQMRVKKKNEILQLILISW